VSIDSVYSNAAWAAALGGISIPLLSDFHPKGAVADSLGVYLAKSGITDRATVLIDANGVVQYVNAVTPSGTRDVEALVARCEAHDASFAGDLPDHVIDNTVPAGVELYVRDGCMFSRWARYAVANLHLDIPVHNVSTDASRRDELAALGGKAQAPALRVGDTVMYESADIASYLVQHCGAY
jgi:hypothetical protein